MGVAFKDGGKLDEAISSYEKAFMAIMAYNNIGISEAQDKLDMAFLRGDST